MLGAVNTSVRDDVPPPASPLTVSLGDNGKCRVVTFAQQPGAWPRRRDKKQTNRLSLLLRVARVPVLWFQFRFRKGAPRPARSSTLSFFIKLLLLLLAAIATRRRAANSESWRTHSLIALCLLISLLNIPVRALLGGELLGLCLFYTRPAPHSSALAGRQRGGCGDVPRVPTLLLPIHSRSQWIADTAGRMDRQAAPLTHVTNSWLLAGLLLVGHLQETTQRLPRRCTPKTASFVPGECQLVPVRKPRSLQEIFVMDDSFIEFMRFS